jgi:NAD+ kinase
MIHRIGIAAAAHRPRAVECARQLGDRLSAKDIEIVLHDVPWWEVEQPDLVRTDLIVVLGGDGSLLGVARRAAPFGTPVLGVDMGGFGFLAETRFETLCERLDEVIAERFDIDERPMLAVALRRDAETVAEVFALNDAVVARGLRSSLAIIELIVDGQYLAEYAGDGLIVATATGSTGYALSAGGPVVHPDVRAVVVVPICPHTLHRRPLVFPMDMEMRLAVRAGHATHYELQLTVDGQIHFPVQSGDEVLLRPAEHSARLVLLDRDSYYRRLRGKLF